MKLRQPLHFLTKTLMWLWKKCSDFRMVDVGGNRSQQRKWIHCFSNISYENIVISVINIGIIN